MIDTFFLPETYFCSPQKYRNSIAYDFISSFCCRFQYSLGDHDDCDQLNLNTATEDELMTLTGVSRQTARDIVAHRRAIGGFRKVE